MANQLTGNSAANVLAGNEGNDRLAGLVGDDVLTAFSALARPRPKGRLKDYRAQPYSSWRRVTTMPTRAMAR